MIGKKLTLYIIPLLIILSIVVSGCQPTPVEPQTITVKETVVVEVPVEVPVVATAEEVKKEKPIITMWFDAQNHLAEYEARVAEIEEKFDVTFIVEHQPNADQKFQAALMSGGGYPDIYEFPAGRFPPYLKGDDKFIPFLALNNVLESSPYYKQVLPSRWDRLTVKGNIYAAPHDVHPMVLLYNDAAWKEFGIDLAEVQTWDDLLVACQAIPTTMPDGRPRICIMDSLVAANLSARLMQQGVWWHDENGEVLLETPEFKAAIEDWVRFAPYVANIDWANQVAMFKEGQVMAQIAPDFLYGIHKQGVAGDADFMANSPMRVAPVPAFTPDGLHTGGGWGGTAAGVVKQSPNADLAAQIMMYLYFDNSAGQLVDRYQQLGILPPVESIWDDAGFHKPDPYVGGQDAGALFIESAKAMPGVFESWSTPLISAAFGEQFSLVWAGTLDVETAIATAAENAKKNIEKNAPKY